LVAIARPYAHERQQNHSPSDPLAPLRTLKELFAFVERTKPDVEAVARERGGLSTDIERWERYRSDLNERIAAMTRVEAPSPGKMGLFAKRRKSAARRLDSDDESRRNESLMELESVERLIASTRVRIQALMSDGDISAHRERWASVEELHASIVKYVVAARPWMELVRAAQEP
ncbi:MAG: hypothetical protein JWR83_3609, partial [Aeromicrobium sp.]|nr:hypothetical protein [Aeromicrobium sp.]